MGNGSDWRGNVSVRGKGVEVSGCLIPVGC